MGTKKWVEVSTSTRSKAGESNRDEEREGPPTSSSNRAEYFTWSHVDSGSQSLASVSSSRISRGGSNLAFLGQSYDHGTHSSSFSSFNGSHFGGVIATTSNVSGAYSHQQDYYRKKTTGVRNSDRHVSTVGSKSHDEKKLVVQYAQLEKCPKSESLSNPNERNGVEGFEVKARVETASINLEECLHAQKNQELRARAIGHETYDNLTRQGKKVYRHYVRPPVQIDASDAIGIVSSYITAYRALHRTTARPFHKYDKVLVTMAQGALGRAVVELAIQAGASQVYAVGPAKYHSRISRWKAIPLDESDFLSWSDSLVGSIDVVIDIDSRVGGICSAAALAADPTSGKLVRIYSNAPHGIAASANSSIGHAKYEGGGRDTMLTRDPSNTANYDIFEDMENDPRGFRSDLQLLFDMVAKGYLNPKKKKEIPLVGMEYIEVKFEHPHNCSSASKPRIGAGVREQSRGGNQQRDDYNEIRGRAGNHSTYRVQQIFGNIDLCDYPYGESRADDVKSKKGRGRSRSLSRPRFLRGRSRSKSRSRNEHTSFSLHRERSASRGSLREKRRSRSLLGLRSQTSGQVDEDGSAQDFHDDKGKVEHGHHYSSHHLMRNMSTHSFLLAKGDNPDATFLE